MLHEPDPSRTEHLMQQLRQWRREEGERRVGWVEIREVNGNGSYVSYSGLEEGERKMRPVSYGRGDRLLSELLLEVVAIAMGELRHGTEQEEGWRGERKVVRCLLFLCLGLASLFLNPDPHGVCGLARQAASNHWRTASRSLAG
ncbi:hypothetical protein KDA_46840 [Dictyobacter alpinus]|uniref:Uncharacterized protein n=1 Tax=Dictyobacter alpinus TaxID=2014873 RepID=A0A402BD06_9CHLR|nr:hypothetical protein KDA_46840 [Dictyobacter alpinus]